MIYYSALNPFKGVDQSELEEIASKPEFKITMDYFEQYKDYVSQLVLRLDICTTPQMRTFRQLEPEDLASTPGLSYKTAIGDAVSQCHDLSFCPLSEDKRSGVCSQEGVKNIQIVQISNSIW